MSRRMLTVPFATLLLWMLLVPLAAFGSKSKPPAINVPALRAETKTEVLVDDFIEDPLRGTLLSKWLHMLDGSRDGNTKGSSVLAFATRVPGDMARVLNVAGGGRGVWGVLAILARTVIAIALGLLAVFLLKKILGKRFATLEQLAPPTDTGFSRLAAGLILSFPEFAYLLLLAIISTLFFLPISDDVSREGRMLYQLILGLILIFRLCHLVSRILFAPGDRRLRPLALEDSLVTQLHLAFSTSLTILASSLLFIRCFKELGVQPQTTSWLAIILGSLLLAIIAYLVLQLRKPVADFFLNEPEYENSSWLKQYLQREWHIPALLYLAFIWFIGVEQELTGTAVRNGSFVISVLIAPIYFGLSQLGKVLITAVIESLGIVREEEKDDNQPAAEPKTAGASNRKRIITAKTHAIFRVILVAALAMWILSLWGYNFPFAPHLMRAIFESLVALALALLCWRYASKYIEQKMADLSPETEKSEVDIDDEFGGAVQRGRSHTLLPMLRKVIGTVLIVMVTLITISSLGVNIGPLLAGAGVFGLAIGFGAQKLVSDVLSGFFFLLDDAFRVGEYIEGGKTRGTVESITLRNVLLRHHLGMLQVVPHSDLGAITNYMRGGIVIKFPLEFPYDTDIDLVRRIIKKVGVAMQEDPELADGFLQPLKSQGVYGISNSVMVIRVKFTAKPGQQFMIKREAFRRITEALAAKGIHYAHRKVIVDFPEDSPHDKGDAATKKKTLEAAAAAVVSEPPAAAEDDEKKQ